MGRQKMAYACKFSMLLMLVAVASALTIESSTKDDLLQCESIVKNWAASSLIDGVQGDKLKLRDLLFFLHVPRTGGRTYFQCFLRKLYTSDLECPRSYDKLRFDPSQPNCRLMATHDDYSIMSKLPKESTSVVTILRNPVDRVFSTYEFSVEVAARFLIHPNLTSATQITGRLRPKARGVSTLDIWPWKYLVPWMREDLFGRVAGLTNNSCLAESHKVRHCVRKHPVLGQHVLDVAKKRLDNMLYVGLTEEHKESAAMFANVVGVQVLSLLEALNSRTNQAVNNRTELTSSFPESEHDSSNQLRDSIDGQKLRETPSVKKIETADENTTVVKLMEAYEACISSLRKSQASRRVSSLKRISPANFSKEARLQVPETLLQQILLLNSLDVELYKHAQNIFAQQRKHFMQKLDTVEIQESMPSNSSGHYAQKAFWLAVTTVFVVLIIVLFVTSRRRTSKLKV
ncbi:protein-tyrosine sulfotransferase-like isoform X4 [Magnolia sinica]|uniref:protein-tyrosine sulfotransferase-like isoform X4 n=1 Tax=Magnolia sinica TaxID=86752 RepID=UPI00265ADBFD|nr:protein-tyrosine sulfotransferase-like isoform X4 [Magnolia sinica]